MLQEQTIVLRGPMTAFTTVCDACVEEQLAELGRDSWVGASVTGSLGIEHDRGWATCARGHRIRVIRAGRPAEPMFH